MHQTKKGNQWHFGMKAHIGVDEDSGLVHHVECTAANEQERAQVRSLAQEVRCATGDTVKVAFVDQGYTGDKPAEAANEEGIDLRVIRLPEAKKGFVLLPGRWVVERSFGWINRFRRLARDYKRLPDTLAGLHFVVFTILMLVTVPNAKSGGPVTFCKHAFLSSEPGSVDFNQLPAPDQSFAG